MNDKPLLNKLIVITRPKSQSRLFKRKLESLGAHVYLFPCIKITRTKNNKEIDQAFSKLDTYDWIVFTSANGVRFFIDYLKKRKQDPAILSDKKIAAVGLKTAEKIRSYNLTVHFIPSKFTTQQLGKELTPRLFGKESILLMRSSIALNYLENLLSEKGAKVTNIPIYQTEFINSRDETFEHLLLKNNIDYLVFTSASTVNGFIKRINNEKLLRKAFSIAVVSIGPVTTKTALKQGFRKIFTAEEHTVDGIIEKLKRLASRV